MYHSYIWDFDGTLFDSYPIMLEAFLKTLKDAGFDPDSREIYRILKASSSKQVAEKYQLDFIDFSARFKAYEALDERLPVSFPGTKEALQAVVDHGGKNYILTHRDVVSTKELFNERKILTILIVEIVGPENKFSPQAGPNVFELFSGKISNWTKQTTVMIGDRAMDVLAGRGAGVQTMFYDIEGLLTDLDADHVVHSMKEIEEIIKS